MRALFERERGARPGPVRLVDFPRAAKEKRTPGVLLLALSLWVGCAACAPAPAESAATLLAMDTVMELAAYGDGGGEAVAAAEELIHRLEGLFSVTDANSEIARANRGETVNLSPETAELLGEAVDACASTGGALDLTIYPLVKAWGFTTGEYQVPEAETVSSLLERVDYTQVQVRDGALTLPAGVEIDLGAAAKGFTGDRILALFRGRGITSAKLTLGGNVQVLGSKPDGSPWRIAIRAPAGEGYAGVVEVADRAVVTSGGYERCFERDGKTYWHILDPATGYPADSGLASVTIVCQSGTWADCLSTALFVMGRERAVQYWRAQNGHLEGGFDFILLGEDGAVTITKGLEDAFALYGDWKGRPLEVVEP